MDEKRMIKFGTCLNLEECLSALPREADFIEINATELSEADDETYHGVLRAVESGKLKLYSSNCFFPWPDPIVGEGVDKAALRAYIDKTFYRLAECGVKTVVFGSGKQRSIPEGGSARKTFEELTEIGLRFSDNAAKYGQIVVMEPLRRSEDNIINSIAMAKKLCGLVDRENFATMVDFYHFADGEEDHSVLTENFSLIRHAHIASPMERSRPITEADWQFFTDEIRYLQSQNYQYALSFEGGRHSAADLDVMLKRMKAIANGK